MNKENKKDKFTTDDICLIIPTYNRAEDIEKTLLSLLNKKYLPGKIIIGDQSKDDKTRKIARKYSRKLPIDYFHSNIPSANITNNIGIRKARDKYALILTAGDDVDFIDEYFKEMAEYFNKKPKVIGIGGAEVEYEEYDFKKFKNKLANFFLRLFFLPHKEKNRFRIVGPYGNTSSPKVEKDISAQWIPGFNECLRSEVYKNYLWPEIKGYDVLSDIDSSYRIYKKYGEGSLIITTKCKVHHRYSHAARYVEKKRIFVNHEDHFSFYYIHFNDFTGKLKLLWSLVGIIVGNFFRLFIKPKKAYLDSLKYNLQAIYYCYKNRNDIKKKNYRTFLNDDLSMKF